MSKLETGRVYSDGKGRFVILGFISKDADRVKYFQATADEYGGFRPVVNVKMDGTEIMRSGVLSKQDFIEKFPIDTQQGFFATAQLDVLQQYRI